MIEEEMRRLSAQMIILNQSINVAVKTFEAVTDQLKTGVFTPLEYPDGGSPQEVKLVDKGAVIDEDRVMDEQGDGAETTAPAPKPAPKAAPKPKVKPKPKAAPKMVKVLVETQLLKDSGYTLAEYEADPAWTEAVLIENKFLEWVEVQEKPAITYAPLTAEEVDGRLIAKATAAPKNGEKILKILKERWGVTGVGSLDPSHYPELLEAIEEL